MKHHLFWFFAFFFSLTIFAQKQTVFEQELLVTVLPNVEAFYQVHFSYTDAILKNKKVSIVLDKIITIQDIIHTLSAQTQLKFEVVDVGNVVITTFVSSDKVIVCGQLFSQNDPVANASLQVGNQFYTSDDTGYFKIKNIPYQSEIIIYSFGIKKSSIKAAECIFPNCNIIALQERKEQLDQVVIEDYLTGGISKNVKQTTFKTKKLKVLPGLIEPDVLESINQLPGVSNISETVNSIHIRGGNADQNLVLWNNIKTYNNSHLFGTISTFNPYVVDAVHFINKGTPVQYGDKISSVIDVKSNYKTAKKIKAGAGFNGLHADVFLDIPILKNKFSAQVSGRRSYADVFKTLTFKNYEKRIFQNTTVFDNQLEINQSKNTSWFYDYTVNTAWKLNAKNTVNFNHIYTQNHLNFSALNSNKSNLYIDALDTQNQGCNISWKKEWTPKMRHQIEVYYSKYNLNYLFTNQSDSGILFNFKENDLQDFGLNANFKKDLTTDKQLHFGYQYTRKNFSYSLLESNTVKNQQANTTVHGNSVFAAYQVNVPKEHLFSIGVRANKYSSSKKFYVEPRVILQKFVTPEFSINSTLEYKSQFISQIEESVINNATLENNIWANTNAVNLPILTSYQFTFGGNYTKNNWIIDVEAYFKKIKNIASLQFEFDNTAATYNIGNSSIQGLDFFIKKQFKNYHSWFSYTLNSTSYLFKKLNNNKRFPSNINIDNTIKWSHFYKYKKLHFSLGWVWHNGKPYTKINSTTDGLGATIYSFEKLNSSKLPDYHRLDFSVLYDFQLKKNSEVKYRLGVSVLNVYNKHNILNKTTKFSNNQLYSNTINATQITPNIVFRVFW